MEDHLLSIGALARAGGPPVSALRYYDAAGVLRPAHVDPATGYRWYTAGQVHTARLIASLRQAGLPVAEMVAVLEAPDRAQTLLARHRRRLEADLVAACAHLEAAGDILAQPARCTVATEDLVAALAAVRHAVGTDSEWPGLAGILFHLDATSLRLVGCDRSRIAVATVPVRQPSGPEVRVVAPLAFLDEVTPAVLPAAGRVTLRPHHLEVLGLHGEPLDAAYPDYERLLHSDGSRSVTVTTGELIEAVEDAEEIVVVRLDGDRVVLGAPDARDALGFSRTFLLDTVRAARAEHVALALEDERSALRVSPTDRPDDIGLVMPILLHR